MAQKQTTDELVSDFVIELLERGGRPAKLETDTDLHAAGLTSEDGVEFACMMEESTGIRVPHDENPLAHPNGKRMRTFSELQEWARGLVGTASGGRE